MNKKVQHIKHETNDTDGRISGPTAQISTLGLTVGHIHPRALRNPPTDLWCDEIISSPQVKDPNAILISIG